LVKQNREVAMETMMKFSELNRELAARTYDGMIGTFTANGVVEAPLTNLDSITVGGMEIKNLTAAVHDTTPDSTASGLLGLNFLSNFRMDIDTQKGVLHLERK